MPVVDVEIVSDEPLEATLAGEMAADLAAIFGGPPSGTWVRLRRLTTAHYAEGDAGPPAGVQPIFVTVMRADLPTPETSRKEASRIARAVGDVCHRPLENVHVIYQPPGRGRVAFGGQLLE